MEEDELIEFEKNVSILPMRISKTDNPCELLTEIIVCSSISGGNNYIDKMPKKLTLIRKLSNGDEYKADYEISWKESPEISNIAPIGK